VVTVGFPPDSITQEMDYYGITFPSPMPEPLQDAMAKLVDPGK
jgi:hypothetical protein